MAQDIATPLSRANHQGADPRRACAGKSRTSRRGSPTMPARPSTRWCGCCRARRARGLSRRSRRRCTNASRPRSARSTTRRAPPATLFSTAIAGVTGGVSGFFGMPALMVELPLTTTIMLRAIADIARHNGEDLDTLEARLACLQVFALGARGAAVRADLGYFAARDAAGATDGQCRRLPGRARRRRSCRA